MKLLHKLFIKKENSNKNSNEYKKMLKEYRSLQRKEKELQDKLDLLIRDKITYQIEINNLKKETYKCNQCDVLKENIKQKVKINKQLLSEKEEIQKEIDNMKNDHLDNVTFAFKDNKYFILDKENLYILSKCSKSEGYIDKDNICKDIHSIDSNDILSRFINQKGTTTPFI